MIRQYTAAIPPSYTSKTRRQHLDADDLEPSKSWSATAKPNARSTRWCSLGGAGEKFLLRRAVEDFRATGVSRATSSRVFSAAFEAMMKCALLQDRGHQRIRMGGGSSARWHATSALQSRTRDGTLPETDVAASRRCGTRTAVDHR